MVPDEWRPVLHNAVTTIHLCTYCVLSTCAYYSVNKERYLLYVGTNAWGAKPKVGWRVGQVEDEMGQRDSTDQSHVPGRARRGKESFGRGRERKSPSRNQSRFARGTNRRTANQVRRNFVARLFQNLTHTLHFRPFFAHIHLTTICL